MKKQKPVIGVTSSFERKDDRIVFISDDYLNAVREFGGIPLLIPATCTDEEREMLVRQCDGILLTGGDDIDPAMYGESVWNDTVCPAQERDAAEAKLCAMAVGAGLPMLGVCRGMQFMNIFFGGTLYQDIPTQCPTPIQHSTVPADYRICHSCTLDETSPLSSLLGCETITVNSHHHQAVKAMAPGFAVMGRSDDGIIEAICVPGEPFRWGVQWHPEKIWKTEPSSAKVFEAFIAACKLKNTE